MMNPYEIYDSNVGYLQMQLSMAEKKCLTEYAKKGSRKPLLMCKHFSGHMIRFHDE